MKELVPQFINDYLYDLAQKGRQDSTIKRYYYDLQDFSSWLMNVRKENKPIDWASITKLELELFFEELISVRNYNVRTIRRIHSVLKQVAQYQKNAGSSILRQIEEIDPPTLAIGPLSPSEWITNQELQQLNRSLSSENGLSDQQLETFPFYKNRNVFIIRLFVHYGLTLQEVHELSMLQIKFEQNELTIVQQNNHSRIVTLDQADKQLAYSYYSNIPEPVRPRLYSDDPFIVAFDFKRKTFHWSYDDDAPKRMTMIAIQKMIRMEIKRGNLRKGISAQTLRNTFILSQLVNDLSSEQLVDLIGYTSPLSMRRYENTVSQLTSDQIVTLK